MKVLPGGSFLRIFQMKFSQLPGNCQKKVIDSNKRKGWKLIVKNKIAFKGTEKLR